MDWEKPKWPTHGSTAQPRNKSGKQLFEKTEQPALLPLAAEPVPLFRRKPVAALSVAMVIWKSTRRITPYPSGIYRLRRLWVRWDSRTWCESLMINWRKNYAVHAKVGTGTVSNFSISTSQLKNSRPSNVGAKHLAESDCGALDLTHEDWADATVQARGVEAVRVLVGLQGTDTASTTAEALETSLPNWHWSTHGAYRLRTIRQLLKREPEGQQRQTTI